MTMITDAFSFDMLQWRDVFYGRHAYVRFANGNRVSIAQDSDRNTYEAKPMLSGADARELEPLPGYDEQGLTDLLRQIQNGTFVPTEDQYSDYYEDQYSGDEDF